MEEYKIYKTNNFDDEILQEIVAIFFDEKLARDFIEYQFTLCNNFAILHNGERL